MTVALWIVISLVAGLVFTLIDGTRRAEKRREDWRDEGNQRPGWWRW